MRPRKINDKELLKMMKKKMSQKDIAAHFGCSEPAITKRLKYLGQKTPASFQSLTEKEQSFCLEYAKGNSATEAAMKSYDVSSRDSAKSYGSTLLRKPSIKAAISDIVNYYSPKHARAEKLAKHIHEGSEPASLKGLELAFKLDRSLENKEESYHPPCVPAEDYLKVHAIYNVYVKLLESINIEKGENHSEGYYEKIYHEMLKVLSEMLSEVIKLYESETGKVVAPELSKMVNEIIGRSKKNE
tara:strand:+ start:812 stop:1540 length:729 start_codon:yes stop_codon:yes gene_type:complete